jgi:ubiquinone biosynthesis protein UbiJ
MSATFMPHVDAAFRPTPAKLANVITQNPFLALGGKAIELALGQLVALDSATADRLRALEGRAVDLTWAGPEWGARITVRDGRLTVGPKPSEAGADETRADLGVRATLGGVVNMLMRERGGAGLGSGTNTRVDMSGDASLARELTQLAEKFQPDMERSLADTLGPVFGPQLARAFDAGFRYARQSVSTLAEDAGVFVRDESRDAVAREELEPWLDGVDRLRDGVERLAARVERLRR